MSAITFILSLEWREPLLLYLALVPFLMIAVRQLCHSSKLELFADKSLHPWVVIRQHNSLASWFLSGTWLYVLAWILLVIALAGPRQQVTLDEYAATAEQDIHIVFDMSRSMRASDAEPDRLKRARLEIYDLLARSTNNRVGVTVYTASPHELVPMTQDTSLAEFYLSSIDKLVLPAYGSDHVKALNKVLNKAVHSGRPSSVLWVTDGDIDPAYHAGLKQITSEMKSNNIPLYILDAGTVEGEAVPLEDGSWLSENNAPVVSRSDQDLLRQLVNKTGGAYSPVQDDDSDWAMIYDNGIRSHAVKQQETANNDRQTWQEYYGYALLPSILLLFLSLIPYPLTALFKVTGSVLQRNATVAGAFITILLSAGVVDANDQISEEAYRQLERKDYTRAEQSYQQVIGYRGRFGHGVAAYRLENFDAAIKQFSQAVLAAENNPDRAMALFNLGNAYFKTGNYRAASQVYSDVQIYAPGFLPAKTNLELSLKLVEDLEKRLQQRRLRSERSGGGPRTAVAGQEVKIRDTGILSLKESESDTTDSNTITGVYESLIDKGVEYADLAEIEQGKTDSYTRQQAYSQAQLAAQTVQDRREQLLKRLFEIETGFAAPQDQPATITGVKPW